jgi:hypothetical protein
VLNPLEPFRQSVLGHHDASKTTIVDNMSTRRAVAIAAVFIDVTVREFVRSYARTPLPDLRRSVISSRGRTALVVPL